MHIIGIVARVLEMQSQQIPVLRTPDNPVFSDLSDQFRE
jgi:hypothetical protein